MRPLLGVALARHSHRHDGRRVKRKPHHALDTYATEAPTGPRGSSMHKARCRATEHDCSPEAAGPFREKYTSTFQRPEIQQCVST